MVCPQKLTYHANRTRKILSAGCYIDVIHTEHSINLQMKTTCYMRVVSIKLAFVDLLCFCSVFCLLCLCTRLFICALWSPAGKGLTSWLSFVVSTVSLSLSHWYPGSGVVLDCIDS